MLCFNKVFQKCHLISLKRYQLQYSILNSFFFDFLKSGKVTSPSNRSNIDFGKLNIQQLCQSSFQFQCFLRIPFIFPRFSCGEFASFVRKFRFCGFVVRPSLKIAFLIPVMMLWHHQFAKSSFTNQAENVVFSSLYEKIGEIVL